MVERIRFVDEAIEVALSPESEIGLEILLEMVMPCVHNAIDMPEEPYLAHKRRLSSYQPAISEALAEGLRRNDRPLELSVVLPDGQLNVRFVALE